MGKYRNKLHIIADILSVVRDGAKKTHVMYKANLSYQLLSRYLSEVLEADLVCVDNENFYTLTSRGRSFLERFNEYSQRTCQIEKQLNDVNSKKTVLENMINGNRDSHSNEGTRNGEAK